MALSGLLGDVTRLTVAEKLHQRRPQILISDVPEQLARFEARVRASSLAVRVLVGSDPPAGTIRDLAAEAIALETASATEYAEYPEQQVQGSEGRGYFLHQQYLERLALLAQIIADAGGTVPPDGEPLPATSALPRATMPEHLPYPDPAYVRGITHHLSERETTTEWLTP
jgi:hypothetical protein